MTPLRPVVLLVAVLGVATSAEGQPLDYTRIGQYLVIPEGNLRADAGRVEIHPKAFATGSVGWSPALAGGWQRSEAGFLLAGAELRWRPGDHQRIEAEGLAGGYLTSIDDPMPRAHASLAWTATDRIWTNRLEASADRDAPTQDTAPDAPEHAADQVAERLHWDGDRTFADVSLRLSRERVFEDTFWLPAGAFDDREVGAQAGLGRRLGSRLTTWGTIEVVRRWQPGPGPLPDSRRVAVLPGALIGVGERTSLRLTAGVVRWWAEAGHADDPGQGTVFTRPQAEALLKWDYRDPEEGWAQLRLAQESLPGQGATVADRSLASVRWWHQLPRRFGMFAEIGWAVVSDRTGGMTRDPEVLRRPWQQVNVFYMPSYGWRTWLGLWHAREDPRIAPRSETWTLSTNAAVVF